MRLWCNYVHWAPHQLLLTKIRTAPKYTMIEKINTQKDSSPHGSAQTQHAGSSRKERTKPENYGSRGNKGAVPNFAKHPNKQQKQPPKRQTLKPTEPPVATCRLHGTDPKTTASCRTASTRLALSSWVKCTLTHSLTHSLSPSITLTHSLTHSLPHSFTASQPRTQGTRGERSGGRKKSQNHMSTRNQKQT